jgi:hypothetical protein
LSIAPLATNVFLCDQYDIGIGAMKSAALGSRTKDDACAKAAFIGAPPE